MNRTTGLKSSLNTSTSPGWKRATEDFGHFRSGVPPQLSPDKRFSAQSPVPMAETADLKSPLRRIAFSSELELVIARLGHIRAEVPNPSSVLQDVSPSRVSKVLGFCAVFFLSISNEAGEIKRAVHLAWDKNNPAEGVTNYVLTAKDTVANTEVELSAGNVDAAVVPDLIPGRLYNFSVAAENPVRGTDSNVVTWQAPAVLPITPQDVAAAATGGRSITVFWKTLEDPNFLNDNFPGQTFFTRLYYGPASTPGIYTRYLDFPDTAPDVNGFNGAVIDGLNAGSKYNIRSQRVSSSGAASALAPIVSATVIGTGSINNPNNYPVRPASSAQVAAMTYTAPNITGEAKIEVIRATITAGKMKITGTPGQEVILFSAPNAYGPWQLQESITIPPSGTYSNLFMCQGEGVDPANFFRIKYSK